MAATTPTATATTLLIKSASAFVIAINASNLLLGTRLLGDSRIFTPKTQATALAESQIRYLAAMGAALGFVAWWSTGNLQERQVPLAIAGLGPFVGGLGRGLAGFKHGFGEGMWGAMVAELAIPVGVWGVGWVQGVW